MVEKLEEKIVLIRNAFLLFEFENDVASVIELQVGGREVSTESQGNNSIIFLLCLFSDVEEGNFGEDVVESCLPCMGLYHISYFVSGIMGTLVCLLDLLKVGRREWVSHILLQYIRPT